MPFELGFEREYLGNPYIVGRELACFHRGKKQAKEKSDYYLSHASAMDLHQITTQPQLIVYVTMPRAMRPHMILGTEFRFVHCKPFALFGITEHWIDKHEKVMISDLERTILDGLKEPGYCGGLSEVAKALWIKRTNIDPKKIVNYALKLNVGAVTRRLGYLMDLYEIKASHEIDRLQKKLTATYQLLDPDMLAEGKFLSKWRIRLNISSEELLAIGRT